MGISGVFLRIKCVVGCVCVCVCVCVFLLWGVGVCVPIPPTVSVLFVFQNVCMMCASVSILPRVAVLLVCV